ncbi:uncharacterized protein LOC116613480 [Nematostella vectensis]|uniref:uncharacterized protein LOC116613480 n=1 Tax=Nematostella vectensis TaxID=45351 RepID=UPI001390416E|nr:uncharacterized protein LOC116613480 [Nematostella vectensis]
MAVQIFTVIWRISSLCICLLACAEGVLEIIQPFPDNSYPVVGEDLAVTCVAFDKDSPSSKPVIEFAKAGDFGVTLVPNQGPAGHTYYTNRTELNGRKVFTTLHIAQVKLHDRGRYECQAKPAEEAQAIDKMGFSVLVIQKSEIPTIEVEFDGNTTFVCNMTDTGTNPFQTKVSHQTWTRNNKTVFFAPLSDQLVSVAQLEPLNYKGAGRYTCELGLKLQGMRNYTITASTEVKGETTKTPLTAVHSGETTQAAPLTVHSGSRWNNEILFVSLLGTLRFSLAGLWLL